MPISKESRQVIITSFNKSKAEGATLSVIAKKLNTDGIKTPSGITWTPANLNLFMHRYSGKKTRKVHVAKALPKSTKAVTKTTNFSVATVEAIVRDTSISSAKRQELLETYFN
jgi:hypothetical protein